MKVVSACLCGFACRYDGGTNCDPELKALSERGEVIPVCPEQLGGLSTPRAPAELTASGEDVLSGLGRVITRDGRDVTHEYCLGARRALQIAREHGATEAVLKAKSPSCGMGRVYDGTFTRTLTEGNGVTAALFLKHGIRVTVR